MFFRFAAIWQVVLNYMSPRQNMIHAILASFFVWAAWGTAASSFVTGMALVAYVINNMGMDTLLEIVRDQRKLIELYKNPVYSAVEGLKSTQFRDSRN